MRKTQLSFLLISLLLVLTAVACNERRSAGERPQVQAEPSEKQGIAERAEAAFEPGSTPGTMKVGEYDHILPTNNHPGGVYPDQTKAQKIVNQLYNYSLAVCSKNMGCPKTPEEAKEEIKKQYSLFWPNDPWGTPYVYKYIDDRHCDVTSNGPDGQPDTEDDVKVSEMNKVD